MKQRRPFKEGNFEWLKDSNHYEKKGKIEKNHIQRKKEMHAQL